MDYAKGPWTLKATSRKFEIPEIKLSWPRSHSTNEAQDKEMKASEYGQKELGNAQLISVSPDMYEALKELEWAGSMDIDGDIVGCCPDCEAMMGSKHYVNCNLFKALSKAEGSEE